MITNLSAFARPVEATGHIDTSRPGIYWRQYHVHDAWGTLGYANRTVVVADTTPPTLVCPGDISLRASGPDGALAIFTPTAIDSNDGPLPVTSVPPSGSLFPIGTTLVRSSAADASGNTSTCSFRGKVQGPFDLKTEALTNLVALLELVPPPDIRQPLAACVTHLASSLEATFWIDTARLQPNTGTRVFQEEKTAARLLRQVMDHKNPRLPMGVLDSCLDLILRADQLLAGIAIEDARRTGADARRLVLSERALAHGDKAAERGTVEAPIEHYRNAWNHAQAAVIQ